MRQCALVPAGNHANNTGATTNGTRWLAWCSNLAIYVADLETHHLRHIIAGYSLPIVTASNVCLVISMYVCLYLVQPVRSDASTTLQ